MTQNQRRPESPYGWILAGLLVALFGLGLALLVDDPILGFGGVTLVVVGGTLVLVHTIAAGVRQGMRHVEWDRRAR